MYHPPGLPGPARSSPYAPNNRHIIYLYLERDRCLLVLFPLLLVAFLRHVSSAIVDSRGRLIEDFVLCLVKAISRQHSICLYYRISPHMLESLKIFWRNSLEDLGWGDSGFNSRETEVVARTDI